MVFALWNVQTWEQVKSTPPKSDGHTLLYLWSSPLGTVNNPFTKLLALSVELHDKQTTPTPKYSDTSANEDNSFRDHIR